MIKCLIVDDEPLSREVITNFISNVDGLELLDSLSNALDAMSFLNNNHVDLLFLDINMPEISGLSLLKQTPNPPATIFITAYSEFAVEGFDLNVVDYLVKPVAFTRFVMAINKAKKRIKDATISNNLIVRADKRTYNLALETIFYLQSAGDYIKVFSKDHNLVINETMKDMETRLGSDFVRIHKSFIVNIKHMQYLEGNQIKIHNKLLPIGAKYREEVMQVIKK